MGRLPTITELITEDPISLHLRLDAEEEEEEYRDTVHISISFGEISLDVYFERDMEKPFNFEGMYAELFKQIPEDAIVSLLDKYAPRDYVVNAYTETCGEVDDNGSSEDAPKDATLRERCKLSFKNLHSEIVRWRKILSKAD